MTGRAEDRTARARTRALIVCRKMPTRLEIPLCGQSSLPAAFGRLRRPVSGSNCALIPPAGFKPPAAGWRKGWDWSPAATCLRLELRSSSHRQVSSRLRRAGGRGGIGRLRRPVSGSNCVLHPTGRFQARLRRAGGRGGIGRLRRPVSGSNCVLHPTGMFQAACGGLAEGVGLVACGDLSPARTAFFIPPACFKPPAAGWRKGWDSNPRWA